MNDQKMSGALQENVLTLLCFDTDSAKLIRNVVDPKLFESRVYQDIASHAIGFLDQYGEAIKEHLPDVMEAELGVDDKRKAALMKRTLQNLFDASSHMNARYVLSQLTKFVHLQQLKGSILEAVDHVEAGRVEEAEVVLEKGMKAQVNTFDRGLSFADPKQSLLFLDTVDDGIPTGIKELDVRGVQPSRGTMYLLIAPAKKGKSWFLAHVGKFALLGRLKVLYVSLEMSQEQVAQRFVQSLFSVTKRQSVVRVPRMRLNAQGQFMGIDHEEIERMTLRDDGIKKKLERKIAERFKTSEPLVIKRFPTHGLTVKQYEAYLDSLERFDKFIPDVVLFDYPDLMEINSQDLRIELGKVFKQLRGIAVERNHALVTVTQGNRQSSESRTTTDAHVAEDYSKIGTADNVLTYSQTIEEKKLGLARLFVSNARGDEDKFSVLITQSYSMGQFALDSSLMLSDYWDKVEPRNRRATDDTDEE